MEALNFWAKSTIRAREQSMFKTLEKFVETGLWFKSRAFREV